MPKISKVLITGFGPFPGAPSNPSMRIARRLGSLRRVAFAGVRLETRLLPTTWAMLDDVPALIDSIQPELVLMFGLAGRRRKITPELQAANVAGILRPDAEGRRPASRHLALGGPRVLRTPLDPIRLVAGLRREGLRAAVSRDAGDYLCNALTWRVLETGVPAIFIHVPRPARATRPRKQARPRHGGAPPRPLMDELHRAGEFILRRLIASCVRHQRGQP